MLFRSSRNLFLRVNHLPDYYSCPNLPEGLYSPEESDSPAHVLRDLYLHRCVHDCLPMVYKSDPKRCRKGFGIVRNMCERWRNRLPSRHAYQLCFGDDQLREPSKKHQGGVDVFGLSFSLVHCWNRMLRSVWMYFKKHLRRASSVWTLFASNGSHNNKRSAITKYFLCVF